MCRQGIQMPRQMGFNLPLGFDDKSETGCIAAFCRDDSACVSTGIPERVHETGMRVQFFQASGSPGKMIFFFYAGMLKLTGHFFFM